SVIGADPEAIRNRPAELRLYPRTVADPRAVDRARQESDRIKGVNDLIVQLLSIRGEGGVECAFAVTEGSLEATGAFRRQRRIADETAGEEAEQVEEGRRRNPLAERAGNRKAASEVTSTDARTVVVSLKLLKMSRRTATSATTGASSDRHSPVIESCVRRRSWLLAPPNSVSRAWNVSVSCSSATIPLLVIAPVAKRYCSCVSPFQRVPLVRLISSEPRKLRLDEPSSEV